jgi:hypothetical protein
LTCCLLYKGETFFPGSFSEPSGWRNPRIGTFSPNLLGGETPESGHLLPNLLGGETPNRGAPHTAFNFVTN